EARSAALRAEGSELKLYRRHLASEFRKAAIRLEDLEDRLSGEAMSTAEEETAQDSRAMGRVVELLRELGRSDVGELPPQAPRTPTPDGTFLKADPAATAGDAEVDRELAKLRPASAG